MPILSDLIYASTAAKHLLSITFRDGVYPPVLRVEIISLNAVTMAASVHEGMAWTMIALRSYTYATNMYCLPLNERTGKAPVMSVYIVPVIALARAAKQKISCTAHSSCCGNMRSTLVRAATMVLCALRVDAVLDLCQCM